MKNREWVGYALAVVLLTVVWVRNGKPWGVEQLRCDAVIYVPPFDSRGVELLPTMYPQRFENERVMRCDGDVDEINYLFNYHFRVEAHDELELYHFRHPDMVRKGSDLEKPKKLSGVFIFLGRWVHP